TGFASAAEAGALRRALAESIAAFDEVAAALARRRGWAPRDFSGVREWLSGQTGAAPGGL
ncbi:MAG TPA: hypothetical protein VK477_02145, partial [Acidobacteriota bacterium]|nr:hypothetical protein [Acidobacteriota bacterium]